MTTLVDAPSRVDGVQLIGEMVGSGYRTPPALVRRGDGQVLQLTPLLYLVLDAVDGSRSYAEVGDVVGRALQRTLLEEDVRTLVDEHLRPLGLVAREDGVTHETRTSDPLLGLRMKLAVTSPEATRRVTDPFRVLFNPLLMGTVLVAFVAVVAWVFFERGLGGSAYDAFDRPHLLLLVFAVSVLAGGFHEFGHAAAARYGGAQPGVMGAGLYLVWPAFYTDVTDSYRLGRGGRIRTDLGGLYFNAIVAVGTFVWWAVSGWEALLLLVATQVLQMTQQLLPLLRYDGYHLLADLAGVPDLYHRMGPTLRGLLPQHWRSPENRVLKPWSRALITLWVLVTVPMMALMLFALVTAVPRVVGSAGASISENASAVGTAWQDGAIVDVAANAVQVLSIVLPVVAGALILGRVSWRWFSGLASWSRGSVGRRVVALGLAGATVTAVSWAWYPQPGAYRPIQPDEQNLFTSFLPGARASASEASASGRPGVVLPASSPLRDSGPLTATFEQGTTLPTEEEPSLAVVLVPTDGSGSGTPTAGSTAGPGDGTAGSEGVWVFPFDRPLPPEEGDNQALAVNTTDGTATYDLAFALVWVEDDEALNVNEAHAYASCSDCVSVAVAFQVVLVPEDTQVIVPQNLAVAANYDCYRCITAAIAHQLVLTVAGEPGEEQLTALADVWAQLAEFGASISDYTLAEIDAQLDAFKEEITAILQSAPAVEPSEEQASGATATASPTATATPEEGASDAATPSDATSTSAAEPSEPTAAPTSAAPATADPSPEPAEADPTVADDAASESAP